MQHIHDLIRQNGDLFYLITFIWTALEGETFVIFAGLAAQKGALNVWLLFLAAWLGSMCGDQMFFFIGRRYGTRILKHFPKLKAPIDKAISWLEKYATVFILSYRFMYGIRNVSGVAIGMSNLPWKKFALLNAIAAFVWAAAFVGFGFVFGGVIGRMRHKQDVVENSVHEITFTVLGLFALIVVCKLLIIQWQKYKNKKKD